MLRLSHSLEHFADQLYPAIDLPPKLQQLKKQRPFLLPMRNADLPQLNSDQTRLKHQQVLLGKPNFLIPQSDSSKNQFLLAKRFKQFHKLNANLRRRPISYQWKFVTY